MWNGAEDEEVVEELPTLLEPFLLTIQSEILRRSHYLLLDIFDPDTADIEWFFSNM